MSSTVRAALAGSSASSQPRGLPVSTAQKRQARVQTLPMSMMVAVPLPQHSPMFGHMDSSQTVASRCSRTMPRTSRVPAAAGQPGAQPGGLAARATVPAPVGAGLDAVPDGGEAGSGAVLLAALRRGSVTTAMPRNSLMRRLFSHGRVDAMQAMHTAKKKPGTRPGNTGGSLSPVGTRRAPFDIRQKSVHP